MGLKCQALRGWAGSARTLVRMVPGVSGVSSRAGSTIALLIIMLILGLKETSQQWEGGGQENAGVPKAQCHPVPL